MISEVEDPPRLSLKGVSKRFGSRWALRPFDLEIQEAVIYGLLGPNGAGKTTTLRILTGLIRPTSGAVHLFGNDIAREKSRVRAFAQVGAHVEGPAFYPHLTGMENLRVFGRLAGVDGARIEETIQLVGLTQESSKKYGRYSHGMRQRLGLAAALLKRPRLLILDEPTDGLDPVGIVDLRNLLQELRSKGSTVLLSSHNLVEIERLCERATLLDEGKVVFEGLLSELLDPQNSLDVLTPNPEKSVMLLESRGFACVPLEGGARVRTNSKNAFGLVAGLLSDAGIEVTAIVPTRPSLEEVFVRLRKNDADFNGSD